MQTVPPKASFAVSPITTGSRQMVVVHDRVPHDTTALCGYEGSCCRTKDLAYMQRMKAMLHAHGIQAICEPTSLSWRSAGWESFVMASTEDYLKASALCLTREMAVAFNGGSPLLPLK
jgi:hypothetical protein